jgi:hypothetical protein
MAGSEPIETIKDEQIFGQLNDYKVLKKVSPEDGLVEPKYVVTVQVTHMFE